MNNKMKEMLRDMGLEWLAYKLDLRIADEKQFDEEQKENDTSKYVSVRTNIYGVLIK